MGEEYVMHFLLYVIVIKKNCNFLIILIMNRK